MPLIPGLIISMSQAIILPQYPGDFSLSGHTHSQYLTSHQSLTNYATKTYVDNAISGIDTSTVPSHSHSNYASSSHTHDYASSSHTHSYASTSHTHSGYASSSHSHSGYASSSHTHSSSDITGLSGGSGSGFTPFEAFRIITEGTSYTLSESAKFIISFLSISHSAGIAYVGYCFAGQSPVYSQYATAKLSSNGKTVTTSIGIQSEHIIAFK